MSYKKKTRLLSICLVLVMLLQLLPVNVLGYRAVDLSEAEASPVENTLADSGEDLEYFNGSGRIIAIVNRFGNTIRFEYTLSGSQVTQIKITDTVGRVITFKDELMDPTETAQIRVQSRRTNYNVKWTLWLDDELVRTYYSYYDTENTNQPRCLMGVSNEKGEFIRLTTQICSKRFNVYLPQSDTDSDGVYYTTELKEVRYPDGSSYEIEHFSQFSNPKRSAYEKLGLSGFMATNELYEVNQQYLYDNVI